MVDGAALHSNYACGNVYRYTGIFLKGFSHLALFSQCWQDCSCKTLKLWKFMTVFSQMPLSKGKTLKASDFIA